MNQETDCSSAGSPAMRVESMPFSDLPGQTKLFLDYLSDPLSLTRFYPSAVGSHVDLANRVPEILERYTTDRAAICDVLLRQNDKFGGGESVRRSISFLRGSHTVAVMTGQQAGLFTGPLYTIYKALSAVRLAACLRSRGVGAVPIFWAATEDHDFDEIAKAAVIGQDGEISEIVTGRCNTDNTPPVGDIPLGADIEASINGLISALPASEFTSELKEFLAAAYLPGRTYGEAFASTVSRIFGKFGLIVVDPLDLDLKALAAPMYRTAVERAAEIVSAVRGRSAELANAGYHAQVSVESDYFPLFYHDENGSRVAMRTARDGSIRVSGTSQKFSVSELAAIAEDEPQRFSPGVILRPVVQDHLFPTICYFGGAAEIAYFAQSSAAYQVLDRPVTPILHRQSFSVVEARHSRSLQKLGLDFRDLFAPLDELRRAVVRDVVDPENWSLFTDVENKVNAELDRLDAIMWQTDVSLTTAIAKRRRKIAYHIEAIRRKFEAARIRKETTFDRQLSSAISNLVPAGLLQERTVNVFHFLDRYGWNFIDWIYDSVDLDDKGHRIIYL